MIVALPRTGSSMLMRLFKELRGLPFIYEPFNRDQGPALHPPCIHWVSGLMERLHILSASGAVHGVKHVHDPLHWELGTPLGWTLLQALARLPECRIVFLYRKNLLRQFFSMEVAQQTRNWSITDEASLPQRIGPIRLDGTVALDDAQVETSLARLETTVSRIAEELGAGGAHFLPTAYEEVYGAGFDATCGLLDRIAEHFEVPRFHSGEHERLRAFLDQGQRQTKLSRLYRETDHLRNLESRLGGRFGSAYPD